MMEYFDKVKKTGYFINNRKGQDLYWMHENIDRKLKESFYNNKSIMEKLENLRNDVKEGKISSFNAANKMLDYYFRKSGKTI
jgi:LAO/AO transport system kinase